MAGKGSCGERIGKIIQRFVSSVFPGVGRGYRGRTEEKSRLDREKLIDREEKERKEIKRRAKNNVTYKYIRTNTFLSTRVF